MERLENSNPKGAGRKPDWFRAKCAELACSEKFFTFAQEVFDGKQVDPKITKLGVIYMEASVHDKVYLWEKVASYGFGKPDTLDPKTIAKPIQKLLDENQMLRLLGEYNFPERGRSANSASPFMGTGTTSVQAESPSAPSV